jgi:hypothetical protein
MKRPAWLPGLDSVRQTALPYLTNISHVSAPFITTFLLVHLTPPVLANFGGSSLASQTLVHFKFSSVMCVLHGFTHAE